MRRSRFLSILLVSCLLVLSTSHGFGRKLMQQTAQHQEGEDDAFSSVELEESAGISRMMIEVMDYPDPGPNINPRTGYLLSPPPSTPPSHPSP